LGYEYIAEVGGIASNESYPYCVGIGGKNSCYPCTAPDFNETLCGPGLYPPSCNDTKWPCR
jgi:cathepsin F